MAEKFWVVLATLSDGRLAVINPELNVLTLWPAFGGEDSRWQVERVSDDRIVASHQGETRVFIVAGPMQEVDLHTAARAVVRILRKYEATIEGEA